MKWEEYITDEAEVTPCYTRNHDACFSVPFLSFFLAIA